MAKFTDAEVEAELKRRAAASKQRDKTLPHSRSLNDGDTRCLHCGSSMRSWQATDKNNPICETCLHD